MTANCIFMDTVCKGKIPALRNESGGFLLHTIVDGNSFGPWQILEVSETPTQS